ncbi:hypothetical protein GJAV_G00196860 [Gymnothorax javanicus]|nr:hypothetical protein GJAV_G00196860 [Gymnothorax javanicus]
MAVRGRCGVVLRIVCVCLICTLTFYPFLQKSDNMMQTLPPEPANCSELKDQILTRSSLKNVPNLAQFFLEVKEMLSCPWTANLTQAIKYKMDLRTHCNASDMLFLTKQNTKLGQRLTYEVHRKSTKLVDKALHEMLPETAPWGNSRQLGRCALVGNGGILRNSSCGKMIDTADFVIRFNLAPMNYTSDVGVKTSLVTVNPSQISGRFASLCKARQPFVDTVAAYGKAHLVIPAFSYVTNTELSFRAFYTIKEMRPQQGVLYLHQDYLLNLQRYWRKKGQKALRLSSGFMLMSAALELCEKVDLYGFWPFDVDLGQKPLLNHYYDNVPAKPGVHSMSEEFLKLLHMHSQGVLQLHVGKCR